MSEWLTTGEMIDRLKVGEVAEGVDGLGKEYCVTKTEYGMSFCSSTGDTRGYLEFTLNKNILGAKWRILPRYVTFDQAMKALAEGKTVWAWVDGEKRLCYWIDQESGKLWGMSAEGGMTTVHNIGFFKEWTIEEDK
ncbi:hypothetical protein P9726_00620 [Geobacillus stearothermophilus]|uniref:hypothetical protein n=1 Tax=Geobacillus stearothermophilus TaxID=1422 RepID=UPI002E250867|nr:hypothetical protein [Geobacillus stearothermophilus]